jgi:hypothetical protein
MSSVLDHTVGMGVESTFGTAAVETRWFEVLPDSTVDWDNENKQGAGLRVSSIVPRTGRRRSGLGSGTITIKCELYSKGFGLLLSACLPTSVSTLVSGTTYQQLHTLVQTGISMGSRTLQVGIVDTSGVSRPHRFTGCTVSKWTLDVPAPDSDDAVTLEVEFDCRRVPDTATALTAPVMPATPTIYLPKDMASITYGGAVTVPTATALATGGTAVAYWRGIKIECDNNLGQRPNQPSVYAQPSAGLREPTITADIEYADAVMRDAFLAQTSNPFSFTLTTPEALSTGFATFQFVAPAVQINAGAMPTWSDGEVAVFEGLEMAVTDLLVAGSPLYVAVRTSDAAL